MTRQRVKVKRAKKQNRVEGLNQGDLRLEGSHVEEEGLLHRLANVQKLQGSVSVLNEGTEIVGHTDTNPEDVTEEDVSTRDWQEGWRIRRCPYIDQHRVPFGTWPLTARALGPYLLILEMRIYDDGEEFYVEDWEKWIEYQPKVGTIIEVDGSSTDQSFPSWTLVGVCGDEGAAGRGFFGYPRGKVCGVGGARDKQGIVFALQSKTRFYTPMCGKAMLVRCRSEFARYSLQGLQRRRVQEGLFDGIYDSADEKVGWHACRWPNRTGGNYSLNTKACAKGKRKTREGISPGSRGRRRHRCNWSTWCTPSRATYEVTQGQTVQDSRCGANRSFWGSGGAKLLLRRKFKLCVGNAGDRNGTCRHQTGDMDLEADQGGSEESVEGESTQDPNQGPWQPTRRSGRRKEPTGFKRWYLERDAVTAGSESRSGGQRKSPRKGPNPKVFRKLSGEEVDQVVDRQDLQKRQRIFQRQAEEDEKEGTSEESETGSGWPGRWTDGELRQQLQYRLGEREGFAVRGRAGAPVEEESQATSGIGVEDAAVPCQSTTGSELKGGVGTKFESGYHIWGETYELLRDMCEADAPTEHGGPEGSSSLELGHRPTPAGRPHATWRLSGFKVRRHSPGCSGWRMASGKTLRALPHGRWRSSQQCSASRDSTARQVGSKSSGPRLSQLEGPGKRKRKEGKERTMGVLRLLRERRRKEREGRQRDNTKEDGIERTPTSGKIPRRNVADKK